MEAVSRQNSWTFYSSNIDYSVVETKSGKQHFVSGYITTGDMDLYNDVVTKECMKSILNQLKSRSVTLDYEHEAYTKDPSILPVARIVEADMDDKGVWVKAILNEASPKFSALWDSIKGGFVNSFSIAYKAINTVSKKIGEKSVRLLNDVNLLNVAMTGNPVNPAARMDGFGMKAVIAQSIKNMEDTMVEAEVKSADQIETERLLALGKQKDAELKAEEEKEKKKKEEDEEEEKEEKEEMKSMAKELKSLVEMKSQVEVLSKDFAEMKAQLKAIADSPFLKSPPTTAPEKKSQEKTFKGPLGLI